MAKYKKASLPVIGIRDSSPPVRRGILLGVLAALFFFLLCTGSTQNYKAVALTLMIATLVLGCISFPLLRSRIHLPLIVLVLFLLMSGISTAYALSGKFALQEFTKLIIGFCAALLLLMLTPGEGVAPGRRIAIVLESTAALSSLLSVDLISTRFLSTPILGLMKGLNPSLGELTALVPGVRLNSIFENPNVFAGCAGIGIVLALGLTLSAPGKKERCFHLCCLYITSAAFILAFSMGGIASIAVGFVAYLLLEQRNRRSALLLLMIKTFILVMASVAVISATSFDAWSGIRPIPLLCLAVGCVLLCLADRLIGLKPAALPLSGIKILIALVIIVVLLIGFAAAALRLTGPVALNEGEYIRRTLYLEPGSYTIEAVAEGTVTANISAQSREQILYDLSSKLLHNDLAGATFIVPEGAETVQFLLVAREDNVTIRSVVLTGPGGSQTLPLNYKLLPSFIAHRVQGLATSETAIERLYLFENGLALFKTAPLAGLGLGSFETAIYSVQSLKLETKYVHNHYIQTMLETGIIGLILFLGLFGTCATCILHSRFSKKGECHPLAPALGAALAFMAVHAFVEVDFSFYAFLPFAFGVFTLINLCCGEAISLPFLRKKARSVILLVLAALLLVFAILLGNNMTAARIVKKNATFGTLEKAAKLDKFEWVDYKISYVIGSLGSASADVTQTAARYADELCELTSNSVPYHLTRYYLTVGQPDKAMAMAEKYIRYCIADEAAWNNILHLLAQVEYADASYTNGIRTLAELLETHNAATLVPIRLDEASQALLERYK